MGRTTWMQGAVGVACAVGGFLVGRQVPAAPGATPAAADPCPVCPAPAREAPRRQPPVVQVAATGDCPAQVEDLTRQLEAYEGWCENLVWAAGGAMPLAWPEDVLPVWEQETLRSTLTEAVASCEAMAGRWSAVDCEEYPCSLWVDGTFSVDACPGLPKPIGNSVSSSTEGVLTEYRFAQPGLDETDEALRRRRRIRHAEATDLWKSAKQDADAAP